MVLRDTEHIHNALELAPNIYYYEGFNKIQLRYNSSTQQLHRMDGSNAYKPISDVKYASYSQGLGAWEIVWLV